MRITSEQIEVLSALVRRYFGYDTSIWLFGSRADDQKKGGDYDFLIETSLLDADKIIDSKVTLLTQLQNTVQFEDEKIDIIVKRRANNFDMPIYQVAMLDGVKL